MTIGSHLSFPLFFRSILECEKLVKATYRKNGLVYRESSSEDEGGGGGPLSSEVIEIDDDDDDDVIAVGCCKLCKKNHCSVLLFSGSYNKFTCFSFVLHRQWFLQRRLLLRAKIQWWGQQTQHHLFDYFSSLWNVFIACQLTLSALDFACKKDNWKR